MSSFGNQPSKNSISGNCYWLLFAWKRDCAIARRHSREIYDIATQRAPFLEISSHLALVRREIVNQVEILIPYQRVQPWRPLFRDAPLNPEPQSPEDATKLRIFSFLQRKLQTTKSRSRGISDSLLKHLTELVASGALNNPRYSGALQKQRKRHPDNRA